MREVFVEHQVGVVNAAQVCWMTTNEQREQHLSSSRRKLQSCSSVTSRQLSCRVAPPRLDMGTGLAARFSWICLLLLGNAASAPVQHKYQPRPPYKSSSGPASSPEGLRPSLLTLQQMYAADPTPVSQPPSSPEIPSQASPSDANKRLVAYARNSNKRSGVPAAGSGWPFYDPTASNAGQHVKTMIASAAKQSWPLYSPVFEPSSSFESPTAPQSPVAGKGQLSANQQLGWADYSKVDVKLPSYKPSTGGVKGQHVMDVGGNLPPSWATYSQVYELPTRGVKGRPQSTVKGQQASNPGGNLQQSWAAYSQVYDHPTDPVVPPGVVKGSPQSTVKGQQASNPGGNQPQSWAGYSQVYDPVVPLGGVKGSPESTVKGQQTSNPGGNLQQSWAAYSKVYDHPTDPVVPPGVVKGSPQSTVKGQQASNPGGNQPQSWAGYSQVYDPVVPLGGVKGSPESTVKGQQTSNPGGNLQQSWAVYSKVYDHPTDPVVPPGGVKGSPQSAVKVSNPLSNQQQSWAGYNQVYDPVVPLGGVKGSPQSTVKGQTASNPGSNLQQSWAAYSQVYDPPTDPVVPVDALKGQTASNPGSNLQQSWAAYSKVYDHPTDPVVPPGGVKGQKVSNPLSNLQQSWAGYNQVYDSVVPLGGVKVSPQSTVKSQQASNPGDNQPQSWARYSQVYDPVGPDDVKGSPQSTVKGQTASNPGSNLQQSWAAYSKVYDHPTDPVVPPAGVKGSPQSAVKGQVFNPLGNLQQSWAGYNQVYDPVVPLGGVKGQKDSNPGSNLQQSWAAYGQVYDPPTDPVVPPAGVKVSNPLSNQQQSWAAYGQVYDPPTDPVAHPGGVKESPSVPVKGQQASNPVENLQQRWAAYSSVEEQPSSPQPATSLVKVNAGGNLPPNWAAYSNVYDQASGYLPPIPVVPPGTVKGQQSWATYASVEAQPSEADTVKGKVAVNPAGGLPPSWELYHPVYEPSSSFEPPMAPESPAPAKGQVAAHQGWAFYSPVDVQPPSYKPSRVDTVKGQTALNAGGSLPPSWAAYSKVFYPPSDPVVPPGGVKGSHQSTVKGQPASSPGGNPQQSWDAYRYQPQTVPEGVKGQQVVTAGGNLPPSWAAYSKVFYPPSDPVVPPGGVKGSHPSTVKGLPASNPGGNPQQSWDAYSKVYEPTYSYQPQTVPEGVKGQQVVNAGGNLPFSWETYSQVYEPPTVPGGVKGTRQSTVKGQQASLPGGSLQQSWAASDSEAHPSSYKVDTVQGQPSVNPVGSLPSSWALYEQPSPTALESPIAAKGQLSGGNLHQGWAMYSPVDVQPPSYKPSSGVDLVKRQPVVNVGVNLPQSWAASSKGYYPPTSLVAPPDTVKGQPASSPGGNLQQSWSAYNQGQQLPSYKPPTAPGLSAGKGHSAGFQTHMAPSPGGVQIGTGKGPAAPHQSWAAYSSAYWSPSSNPSVAPLPSPGGAYVSLPAGKANAASDYSRKFGSGWATYGQVFNPVSKYQPSSPAAGTELQSATKGVNSQVSGPLKSGGVQMSSGKRHPADGQLSAWSFNHGASGLQDSDTKVGPYKRTSSQPGYPSDGLDQLSLNPSDLWSSQQELSTDDDDDDDEEDKQELPTYVVHNRNGYEQERKEFSRMHYSQKDWHPHVPYLGGPGGLPGIGTKG
ncbi:uncharacterized protein LOC144038764 [Vanacampus margaritifer]